MWFYSELPDDAPGADCPLHGPHADDECSKCQHDAESIVELSEVEAE